MSMSCRIVAPLNAEFATSGTTSVTGAVRSSQTVRCERTGQRSGNGLGDTEHQMLFICANAGCRPLEDNGTVLQDEERVTLLLAEQSSQGSGPVLCLNHDVEQRVVESFAEAVAGIEARTASVGTSVASVPN